MTLDQFLQYVTWGTYLLLLVIVLARAVRQPNRANVDIALFFSAPGLIIAAGLLAAAGLVKPGPLSNAILTTLLLMMGYCLLRLVSDFASVPLLLLRLATVGLVLLALATF